MWSIVVIKCSFTWLNEMNQNDYIVTIQNLEASQGNKLRKMSLNDFWKRQNYGLLKCNYINKRKVATLSIRSPYCHTSLLSFPFLYSACTCKTAIILITNKGHICSIAHSLSVYVNGNIPFRIWLLPFHTNGTPHLVTSRLELHVMNHVSVL